MPALERKRATPVFVVMNANRRQSEHRRESGLLVPLALHGVLGAALGCLVGFLVAVASPPVALQEGVLPDFAAAVVIAGFTCFFAVGSALTAWIFFQIERA